MSYNTNKLNYDRKEVIFVDIELDQNDDFSFQDGFALDPGYDGLGSFATPKTTSDSNAFSEDTPKKIYRLSTGSLGIMTGNGNIPYFPIIESISFSTPEVKPGEKLGSSASVSIKLNDIITDDTYEMPGSSDPTRDYSPRRVVGSFLTKLFARNFLENRNVRVYIGYQDPNKPFDINNFRDELYVLKTAKRTKDGGATISAPDPLFLTTEAKAKAPVQSGDTLKFAINNTDTQVTIYTDNPDEYDVNLMPPGDLIFLYPVVMIDKELTSYSVVSKDYVNGEVVLDLVRGNGFPGDRNPQKIVAHDAGVKVQVCVGLYDGILDQGMNVVDIIWNLLINYTQITSEYIDEQKWIDQKNADLAPYNLTSVITKPTAVDKLINELIEISGATLFWDTELKELTLLGTSEFTGAQFIFEEDIHIEQDSLTVTNNDRDHVTRQSIVYNKPDFTENDDFEKYESGFLFADTLRESPAQYDVKSEGKLIKSNWLGGLPADDNIAVTATTRNVTRRSNIPKTFKFTTDPAFVGDVEGTRNWLGSVIGIRSSLFMNPDLTKKTVLAQITKITKRSDGFFDVTAINFEGNVSNADYEIQPGEYTNVDLETSYPPIPGQVTTILIKPGAIIGSTSTSFPAMSTGLYPDGLKIINRGQILGAGGAGGSGDQNYILETEPGICHVDFSTDKTGKNGGDALLVETACTIDNLGGSIYSGGGGGAAQDSFNAENYGIYNDDLLFLGGGGSGGQGFVGGAAGLGAKLSGTSQSGRDGNPGSISGPGAGAFGGGAAGGAWGEIGEFSLVYLCNNKSNPSSNNPGSPGYSVNGISLVTWAGGQTLIKGPTI